MLLVKKEKLWCVFNAGHTCSLSLICVLFLLNCSSFPPTPFTNLITVTKEVTIKHLAKWCQGNSSYPMLRKVEAPLHVEPSINVHALMRVCVKVCLYGAAQMTGCVQAVSAQFLPVPSHGWPNTGTHKYRDRQAHTHSKHIRIQWMPLARLLLSLLCPYNPPPFSTFWSFLFFFEK